MSFNYDDDGVRVSKTVNGVTTHYVYNGNILISEYSDTETIVYIYDVDGSPIGFRYRLSTYADDVWDTYWYAKDVQGDITEIYSSAGVKLIHYGYDAWGNTTVTYSNGGATTSAVKNNLTYRGYYYDSNLGLYYLQSRYYDPCICRFVNADDSAYLGVGNLSSYNLFVYCNNNPITGYDPTGTWDWGTFASGAGQVITGVAAIAVAASVIACATTPVGMVVVAAVTIAAGALTTANGISEIVEAGTGHNYVRDDIMGGNEATYETYKAVTQTVASIGASVCSIYYAINGGNVCFVAGTLVAVAAGNVEIENIDIGDYVWAHNPETGETKLKPVVNVFVNEATELVHVFVNDDEIICTNEHPFYSPVKGWIEACQLRAGDILVSLNGEYIIVEQVQHEILESPIKVYNFEVEDFHTYFVGNGDGVLVHNSCNHNYEWRKERENYWKGRYDYINKNGMKNYDMGTYKATNDNLNRMSRGLAPIGWDNYSVQLHHNYGIKNDFYNYSEVTRIFHIWIHSNRGIK